MSKVQRLMVFKQECRNYFSYQAQIAKLDEKIRSIVIRMQNVHSPSMQKIGSSPSRRELDYIRLIEEKAACEKQKEFYERRLKWIDDIINSIPSRAYCAITWMTLVQGKTRMELIITYDTSPEYVYKTRDQFLRKLLTDEQMKEFEKTEALRPIQEEENPFT
ncbi:MAG: hypothetical protein ACI32N_07890 [Bulleidia sp.]